MVNATQSIWELTSTIFDISELTAERLCVIYLTGQGYMGMGFRYTQDVMSDTALLAFALSDPRSRPWAKS